MVSVEAPGLLLREVQAAVERFGAAAERAINSLRGSSSSPRRRPAGGRQREGGRREEEFHLNRDPRLGLNNQVGRRRRRLYAGDE